MGPASLRLAAVSLVPVALVALAGWPKPSPAPDVRTQQQAQQADPAAGPPYSAHLARDLARLSCFNTPVGEKMGGVVPIGMVSDTDKAFLQAAWKKVLAPAALPPDDAAIEWREVLWSLVDWRRPQRNSKTPDPPRTNVSFARWFVAASPYVVRGATYPSGVGTIGVTITLTGNDRVRFKWPQLEEYRGGSWQIVTEFDKNRLLDVLTTTFQFPWNTADDFVVTWSPSPSCEGHLQILSTQYHHEHNRRGWFDEIWLGIEGSDPQKVSINAIFFHGD